MNEKSKGFVLMFEEGTGNGIVSMDLSLAQFVGEEHLKEYMNWPVCCDEDLAKLNSVADKNGLPRAKHLPPKSFEEVEKEYEALKQEWRELREHPNY